MGTLGSKAWNRLLETTGIVSEQFMTVAINKTLLLRTVIFTRIISMDEISHNAHCTIIDI